MKITSSYAVEIKNVGLILKPTISIYRQALAFLIEVTNAEWIVIKDIKTANERMAVIEKLTHTTKNHIAKYPDFDVLFPKMPSYLRRAAINTAVGIVASYHANYKNWENGGKKGSEPRLQTNHFQMPVFYKDNTFEYDKTKPFEAKIKLFVHNDWRYVTLKLKKTDVRYLQKYWSHTKASSPKLERKYGKYFLRFAFEEKVVLNDPPLKQERICAVDLGLNSDAVCSIMCADGTILARKFINLASDKDQLYKVLNRIRKFQRKYGSRNVSGLWSYARRLNDELAKKIAAAITDFAVLYSADCIVFEYLNFQGRKIRGSKAYQIHMWRKNGIQAMVTQKAHRYGIRISHICAWGTSKLAYDGSGEVTRDKNNHALCTFTNNKHYNCDLNASYNIGARYFIRKILKPLPEKVGSQLQAKVPDVGRRTSCTLDTLLRLNAALAA